MVDFLRNPLDLTDGVKYVHYVELFPDIEDQTAIESLPPANAGIATQELDTITPTKEDRSRFVLTFINDVEPLVTIKNVLLTISGNGIQTRMYNMFDDPDNVRLSIEPALAIGLDYPKLEDGTPDVANMPYRNVAKVLLNSLPADTVNYEITVVDDTDHVFLSESGQFNIIEEIPVNQL